jgi:hypothetical protein
MGDQPGDRDLTGKGPEITRLGENLQLVRPRNKSENAKLKQSGGS